MTAQRLVVGMAQMLVLPGAPAHNLARAAQCIAQAPYSDAADELLVVEVALRAVT
jgi:predicted amidohydrolase